MLLMIAHVKYQGRL